MNKTLAFDVIKKYQFALKFNGALICPYCKCADMQHSRDCLISLMLRHNGEIPRSFYRKILNKMSTCAQVVQKENQKCGSYLNVLSSGCVVCGGTPDFHKFNCELEKVLIAKETQKNLEEEFDWFWFLCVLLFAFLSFFMIIGFYPPAYSNAYISAYSNVCSFYFLHLFQPLLIIFIVWRVLIKPLSHLFGV